MSNLFLNLVYWLSAEITISNRNDHCNSRLTCLAGRYHRETHVKNLFDKRNSHQTGNTLQDIDSFFCCLESIFCLGWHKPLLFRYSFWGILGAFNWWFIIHRQRLWTHTKGSTAFPCTFFTFLRFGQKEVKERQPESWSEIIVKLSWRWNYHQENKEGAVKVPWHLPFPATWFRKDGDIWGEDSQPESILVRYDTSGSNMVGTARQKNEINSLCWLRNFQDYIEKYLSRQNFSRKTGFWGQLSWRQLTLFLVLGLRKTLQNFALRQQSKVQKKTMIIFFLPSTLGKSDHRLQQGLIFLLCRLRERIRTPWT